MKKLFLSLGVAVCGILLSTPAVSWAQECGSFVYHYDGQDNFVPIEDCDNPFSVSTSTPHSDVWYQINGEAVQPGETIPLDAETNSVELELVTEPIDFSVITRVLKHEGENYRELSWKKEKVNTLTATGTYTIVAEVEIPLDYVDASIGNSNQSWWRWLIPAVYAYQTIPFFYETHAHTFTITEPIAEPTGASSVLFLPGIQASRLYAGEDIVLPGLSNNIEVGDILWEQTNDKRLAVLAMDQNGESIYNIYTDDVLDEVGLGSNIYKSLLLRLDKLQNDDEIDSYTAFAYDWRYSVYDVATERVKYPNNQEKSLVDEILSLAESSKTGKVTIISHSNGGLVAKALLDTYQDNLLKDKVDKLVMIGTPQLGAAKGVGALLHGQALSGVANILTKDETVRDVLHNMSGVYTLLPFSRYFEAVSNQPLITTDSSRRTISTEQYGNIDSRAKLNDFLTDSLNVFSSQPPITEPLKLNSALVQSSSMQQNQLDNWRAAEGIQVWEVIGTGLATIDGFEYRGFDCGQSVVDPSFCRNGDVLFKPKARWSLTGDETVAADSASGYQGDKVSAAVNLQQEGDQRFTFERSHANLSESPIILDYLTEIIRFPYLTNLVLEPEFTELTGGFNIIGGFSPINLRVITADGEEVGVNTKEVPGSQYVSFADSTYIILPDYITDYTLEVIGTDEGVFTLEFETLSVENIQTTTSSLVASSTADMIATLEVVGDVPGNLLIDFDGDGEVDEERTVDGGIVLINPSEPEYTYHDLQFLVGQIDNRIIKRYFNRLVSKARYFSELSENNPRLKKIENRLLSLLKRSAKWSERRGLLEADLTDELIEVIIYLRS